MSSNYLNSYSTKQQSLASPTSPQTASMAQHSFLHGLAKSAPRSILKKSDDTVKKVPKFFTGNEPSLIEDIDHEIDQLNISHTKALFDSSHSPTQQVDERRRFKLSSLKKNSPTSIIKKASTRRRRPLSAVYIFHSKEIKREIIKLLVNATEDFLDEFRNDYAPSSESLQSIDAPFFTSQNKDLFVSRLKNFLIDDCDLFQDKRDEDEADNSNKRKSGSFYGSLGLEATMSEPTFVDLKKIRKQCRSDRALTAHIEKRDFMSTSIDESGNIKNENFYGSSLPASSFLANQVEYRQNFAENPFSNHQRAIHSSDFLIQTANLNAITKAAALTATTAKTKSLGKTILNAARTSKKMVRFADSFGLDLENVKLITNASFEAFNQAETNLSAGELDSDMGNIENEANKGAATTKPFLVLIPLFSIKKSSNEQATFMIKMDEYIYDYENKLIKCIIKVKNVSFEKRVFARISFNNWKTFYDLDAIFIRSETIQNNKFSSSPPSMSTNYDYFGFCIVIPEKNSLTLLNENSTVVGGTRPLDDCIVRIEFALCYQVNDDTNQSFWDNNGGENYKFQCFFNKTN